MVKWSPDEKSLLFFLLQVYGNNYHLFTQYFPSRTRDQIKSQSVFLKKKVTKYYQDWNIKME